MSIFKDILNKLLGRAKPAATTSGTPTGTPAPAGSAPTPSGASPASAGGTAPAGSAGQATAKPAPLSGVDVESIMDNLVKESGQTLNWRTSIVDTMKALGIDSSLEHRKELARELHYSGDMNDSAAMNIWLHKRLMQELAANGGKLPADLS
ncbi:DUF3597 domain-containing protein [Cupriavidus oxalaticus]|jgi:hypothetical protein|uniref:DUF3597 domain-containing protein n=1 Tax=Cupriavidus oxalaticus TaxID=96344 RepID=A0A375GGJ8_9BURK|nr:DUF3597 domain-containing protein [Cupriavidus oxalaticus]QEZ44454.1 DUF3597 domain-containing protein [Cupriavidus oxalaticus]QRQ84180.1 DUF3597 domain-containing protein [Cupriavidus oxalaticus]QRQ91731.1 DUF3597 domain-containing protein [Cupriavidus oxalaticus]WQD86316.1 DUF3597 domain-containing protein [Cupriavidus oxalaticus]SPC17886.1 conserved exported hypothetical protein [Cupriavidus oxalaticus]